MPRGDKSHVITKDNLGDKGQARKIRKVTCCDPNGADKDEDKSDKSDKGQVRSGLEGCSMFMDQR